MIKTKKPSHSFGNGQYIGQTEHQKDYFSIMGIYGFDSLLTIPDGTSKAVCYYG